MKNNEIKSKASEFIEPSEYGYPFHNCQLTESIPIYSWQYYHQNAMDIKSQEDY